jgi:hypothetical protein
MPIIAARALKLFVFGLAILISSLLLVAFFDRIPIEGTTLAIDWRGLWEAIQGGNVTYRVGQGFRIAPWDAALVLPLGLLSMRASWGMIALITLVVLVLSVPATANKPLYWLSIFLLVVSFPSLRHMADGNFEALVIAGVVLIVIGYQRANPFILAAGILLAVAKPQETVLVIAALALYALPDIRRPLWLHTTGIIALVAVPFMLWKGDDWFMVMFTIEQQGSIMDMSLRAALNRTQVIPPFLVTAIWGAFLGAVLFIIWRTRSKLSREKAGMLVAASLLISPYAAGNSMLTVLAVGVIPLFLARPLLGGLLIAMISFPFLWTKDMLYNWQAYYGTLTLLVICAVFAYRVWRHADLRDAQAIEVAVNQRDRCARADH